MAKELDSVLHGGRDEPGARRLMRYNANLAELPDGALSLSDDSAPRLIRGEHRIKFHMDGYDFPVPRSRGTLAKLTPAPTLAEMTVGVPPVL